jgi:hypothetical protein
MVFDYERKWDLYRASIVGSVSCFFFLLYLIGYYFYFFKKGANWQGLKDIWIYNLSFLQIILLIVYTIIFSFYIFVYFRYICTMFQLMIVCMIFTSTASEVIRARTAKILTWALLGALGCYILFQVIMILVGEITRDPGHPVESSYECQAYSGITNSVINFILSGIYIILAFVILRITSRMEHKLKHNLSQSVEEESLANDINSIISQKKRKHMRILLLVFFINSIFAEGWDILLFVRIETRESCLVFLEEAHGVLSIFLLIFWAFKEMLINLTIFVLFLWNNYGKGSKIQIVTLRSGSKSDGVLSFTIGDDLAIATLAKKNTKEILADTRSYSVPQQVNGVQLEGISPDGSPVSPRKEINDSQFSPRAASTGKFGKDMIKPLLEEDTVQEEQYKNQNDQEEEDDFDI